MLLMSLGIENALKTNDFKLPVYLYNNVRKEKIGFFCAYSTVLILPRDPKLNYLSSILTYVTIHTLVSKLLLVFKNLLYTIFGCSVTLLHLFKGQVLL